MKSRPYSKEEKSSSTNIVEKPVTCKNIELKY